MCIRDRSGSGKSTLMHVMSGLDRPESGEIMIDGENILTFKQKRVDVFRSEKMAFIFQSFFVQGNESCYNNVGLPLEIARVPMRHRKTRIEKALDAVGLLEKKKQRARDLSGGQKQRLAIARAIVNKPTILLSLIHISCSSHDVYPTIDIDGVAGQAPGVRRSKESAGKSDVHDVNQFPERRALSRLVEQQIKIFQTRCGSCPVSYTHLDVYKRQELPPPSRAFLPQRR